VLMVDVQLLPGGPPACLIKVEGGGFKFFDTRRRISEDSNVLGAELSGASLYCLPQTSLNPRAFPCTVSHTFCF